MELYESILNENLFKAALFWTFEVLPIQIKHSHKHTKFGCLLSKYKKISNKRRIFAHYDCVLLWNHLSLLHQLVKNSAGFI